MPANNALDPASTAWRTALLDSSLDCVIVMDADGRIIDMNRGTEDTFLVNRDEVLGHRLGEVFVPPELREAHERGLARYLQTGESTILGSRVEVPALRGDGSRVLVELSIVRLTGSNPPIFVGHLRTIEEQKRKERRLRASAAASRVLATSSDADSATRELLRAIGEELDWPFVQFWAVSVDRQTLQLSRWWMAEGESAESTAAVRGVETLERAAGIPGVVWATGTSRWIEDLRLETGLPRLRLLIDAGLTSAVCFAVHAHGEIVAVVEAFARTRQAADPQLLLLLEAISGQLGLFIEEHAIRGALAASEARLREVLEREQQARRTAEAANRAKDEFLAVVSHELRTPLGTILGWARMLQSGRLPPESASKAIAAILRNAELQARLVEDLLDMSRIVSGKLTMAREIVDLRSVVEAAVVTLRATATGKGVTLESGLGDAPPILGDPGRLQQVVLNLVANAIKFTPEGGRVDVTLGTREREAEVAVADTGIGIDPDALPHVFEPFWQAGDSTTSRSSGLGLGLAIVRDLVHAHGGRVSVTSDGKGAGATFRVHLPAADPSDS